MQHWVPYIYSIKDIVDSEFLIDRNLFTFTELTSNVCELTQLRQWQTNDYHPISAAFILPFLEKLLIEGSLIKSSNWLGARYRDAFPFTVFHENDAVKFIYLLFLPVGLLASHFNNRFNRKVNERIAELDWDLTNFHVFQ